MLILLLNNQLIIYFYVNNCQFLLQKCTFKLLSSKNAILWSRLKYELLLASFPVHIKCIFVPVIKPCKLLLVVVGFLIDKKQTSQLYFETFNEYFYYFMALDRVID